MHRAASAMTLAPVGRRAVIGGLCISALPALTSRAAFAAVPAQSFAIDTMVTSTQPDFDGRKAIAVGLSAGVMDLDCPVRNAVEAARSLDRWDTALRDPRSTYRLVRHDADFDSAQQEGRFAVVLACQDPAILDTPDAIGDRNVDLLRRYFSQGLRVLQLSYTDRSALGDGYRERTNAGLSHLGERLVGEMNRMGMLIDISHCGDTTSDEAIRLSRQPVAVTHAGCRALFDTRRNKSDGTIRLLADRGGYFGVFNMTMWLTKSSRSSVDDIVDHMLHVRKVGGQEVVGFGSDFGVLGDHTPQAKKVEGMADFEAANRGYPGGEGLHGHMSATDLDGADRMTILRQALERRRLSQADIDGILGLNFRRVFRSACG